MELGSASCCPVLVLRAEHGDVSEATAQEMTERLATARTIDIPGAGHDLHLDSQSEWQEVLGRLPASRRSREEGLAAQLGDRRDHDLRAPRSAACGRRRAGSRSAPGEKLGEVARAPTACRAGRRRPRSRSRGRRSARVERIVELGSQALRVLDPLADHRPLDVKAGEAVDDRLVDPAGSAKASVR